MQKMDIFAMHAEIDRFDQNLPHFHYFQGLNYRLSKTYKYKNYSPAEISNYTGCQQSLESHMHFAIIRLMWPIISPTECFVDFH